MIGKVVVAGLVLVGIVALVQSALLDGITGGEPTIADSGSGESTAASGPTPRPTSTQSEADIPPEARDEKEYDDEYGEAREIANPDQHRDDEAYD
jgi:hypothetical protein